MQTPPLPGRPSPQASGFSSLHCTDRAVIPVCPLCLRCGQSAAHFHLASSGAWSEGGDGETDPSLEAVGDRPPPDPRGRGPAQGVEGGGH